ncbi:MAG: efflux RND transporter permease subunit [Victivallaceae bacterium]|nr:efflux RND transporter permease subunit [Victivallaceae bacterium]
MSVPHFSVRRPVFISMAACIVLILGGVALKNLPVDLMPEITFPALSISTSYEDASPEEMEQLVSRPIEEAVSAVTGVDTVSSTSSEGISSVGIEFTWGTDLDEAASDVRDRLDRVVAGLPDDADRPVLRKFDSASFPIMRLGVGTNLELLEARKLIEDQVLYRLERIDGVASAQLGGGLEREIQILFDRDKIKNLDLTLDEVLSKIKNSNVTTPAGNIKENRIEVRVRTPGVYTSIDEIARTVIAERDGVQIRIGDIGEVVDTHSKVTRYVRVNRSPGIFIQIFKQSGANTVQVADAVMEEIEKINSEMHMVQITPVRNSADYIKNSLNSVADSAIYGGVLAILVLLFFLRNIRSTMIIAISIPMSIIATFALIYFCGYTLNIMTLGGLALGIGMLVDNSIVVLENITRLRDNGLDRREAAVRGTTEVYAAITASTLTTLAVFLPLVFVQGITGVMFRQFSMVVLFSLMCSLFTAITLVPSMAGLLLKRSVHHNDENLKPGERLFAWSGRMFTGLENAYSSILSDALNHKLVVILIALGLLAASVALVPRIGTEFMPKSDAGGIRGTIEEMVGTSPEEVNKTVISMEDDLFRLIPESEMQGYVASAGSSSWHASGGNKADINIKLSPRTERTRSNEEIAVLLGKYFKKIPGVKTRWQAETGMMMGGSSGNGIEVEIRGYDFKVADLLVTQLLPKLEKIDGISNVRSSRDDGIPESLLRIDRDKAADLQVSVRNIAEALRTILAGTSAGEFRDGGDEYTILVKVKDADLLTVDRLLDMTIRSQNGGKVVLRNLIKPESTTGAVVIDRKNQERLVTLTCDIANRDLGSVAADVQKAIDSIPKPGNFTITISGDFEDQQDAFRELATAFWLSLVLVYMVMACQFESLRDPLVVMFSVPLAGIGVILALFLTGSTFNVQSFIGCIMLAGIVVNNAILLVDTANRLRREENMELRPAVCEAGRRRLRPILMTTLTTVLGLVPLALGTGDGGEIQAPMARAVIGGLTSSTFITLFLIPVIYMLAESIRKKKSQDSPEPQD